MSFNFRNDLEPEYLWAIFDYDPDRGELRRRDHPDLPPNCKHLIGKVVGIRVTIRGHPYITSRVIFAMTHGRWPQEQVDHRDRLSSNNRMDNLREATAIQNGYNRLFKTNTSGHKGVFWSERHKSWKTQIGADKRQFHLGYFKDFDEACRIYDEAALKYHGEFARVAED